MIKRLTWWAAGAAMGAVGSTYAQRKVKKAVAQFTPPALAGTAVGVAKGVVGDVKAALKDGRAAMRDRETELRDQLAARSRNGR